jgi:hypothetical protein
MFVVMTTCMVLTVEGFHPVPALPIHTLSTAHIAPHLSSICPSSGVLKRASFGLSRMKMATFADSSFQARVLHRNLVVSIWTCLKQVMLSIVAVVSVNKRTTQRLQTYTYTRWITHQILFVPLASVLESMGCTFNLFSVLLHNDQSPSPGLPSYLNILPAEPCSAADDTSKLRLSCWHGQLRAKTFDVSRSCSTGT